ncbi:MAG TPA: helix-hairpin-helix domain-containing protein [Candidatus Binatia bacterium]|nr:helix-hairpin-helix domain-containing protein [Candidatus Binatia bacterium]
MRGVSRLYGAAAFVLVIGAPGCGRLPWRRPPAQAAPLDLNRASLRRVERLPGITPTMAKKIVEGRPYTRPEDLVERGILTEHELRRIEGVVTVGEGR